MFGSMTDSPNRRDGINWGKVGLYGAGTAVAAGATIHGYKKFMGSKAGQGASDGANWTKETAKSANNWMAGKGGWKGRMGQARRALGFGAADKGGALARSRMLSGGTGMLGEARSLAMDPGVRQFGIDTMGKSRHGRAIGEFMTGAEGARGKIARGAAMGLGWATAADYAGQGMKRAGAVSARAGLALSAAKGVSAGLEWAFG